MSYFLCVWNKILRLNIDTFNKQTFNTNEWNKKRCCVFFVTFFWTLFSHYYFCGKEPHSREYEICREKKKREWLFHKISKVEIKKQVSLIHTSWIMSMQKYAIMCIRDYRTWLCAEWVWVRFFLCVCVYVSSCRCAIYFSFVVYKTYYPCHFPGFYSSLSNQSLVFNWQCFFFVSFLHKSLSIFALIAKRCANQRYRVCSSWLHMIADSVWKQIHPTKKEYKQLYAIIKRRREKKKNNKRTF